MRQSYWADEGIRLRDVEPPPLQDGWVRLQVKACGICGSDLHRLKNPNPNARPGIGGTPGHELTGTVLDSRADIADALYAVEPWLYCGVCEYCRIGKTEHCSNGKLVGAGVAGGLADFIDVPAANLHAADASLSPREASLNEPFGICTRTIHLVEPKMDSRVLVLGAGTLGLICGVLARDYAGRVAVTARYPHQADAARAMGIEPVAEAEADAFAQAFEPDVVIESVGGHANTIDQAMRAVRPGGRVVVQGLFSHEPAFNARLLIMKEIRLVGSKFFGNSEHGPVFAAASRLLPRYRDEIRRMQTHQFALDDIAAAFAAAVDRDVPSIKITVETAS